MTLALVSAASFTANVLIIRALGDYHAVNVWLISCARFVVGLALIYAIYPREFAPRHVFTRRKLIERGLVGLAVFALWVFWVCISLFGGLQRRNPLAWVMAGAVLGMLSLGSVISVTEVPRVLLILTLLMWSSVTIRGQIEGVSRCNRL